MGPAGGRSHAAYGDMRHRHLMRHQGQADLANALQAEHADNARRGRRRGIRPAIYILGVVADPKEVVPQWVAPDLNGPGLAFKFNPGGIVKSNAHRPLLTDQA